MFKVSQSKLKTWQKCRQAYAYRYVDGLRRRKPSRPLKFGTIIHSLVETSANDKPWEKQLKLIEKKEASALARDRDEYGNIIEDAGVIMRAYFDFYKNDKLTYLPYEGRKAEHPFEVPITKTILFKGKIDAFAKTGNGLRWLVEHKTFSKLPSEDHRWRNIQSAVYLWVADKLKVKLDGVMWDYIGSKVPGVPQELKDGSTSIKQIDTLPEIVEKTLKARKQLKDAQYKPLIDMAKAGSKRWFQRIHSRRKPPVIEAIVSDFVEVAREMEDIGMESRVRTIDKHCDWCEYEPLCRAVMQGHDVKFTEKMEYYYEEDEFDYHSRITEE